MKQEKACRRARQNPKGVRFSELCRIAEAFGFRFVRQTGSHVFYVHSAARATLNFQNINGMAKAYQVRQLFEAVDRHGLKIKG